jgi:hypothetical protein
MARGRSSVRMMIDRTVMVESKPETRAELDEALLQLAETMERLQAMNLDRLIASGGLSAERAARAIQQRDHWNSMSVRLRQLRVLGYAAVRIIELVAAEDDEGFRELAENTIKVFLNHVEHELGQMPEVEELTPEEAALLPPYKGKPN